MSLCRRFVRWLARRELQAERERLDAYARQIWGRQPGTVGSLRDALAEACGRSVALGVEWSITQRDSEQLAPGQIRIVIERPSFQRSAA